MWLINTTTLKLEHFIGPEAAPRYAILSHTWGDGEVSFQDFQDLDKAKLKAGFPKIQKTCKLARGRRDKLGRREPLGYAWVDTCCIDKSSSAELSESINSMFNWYRRSKVCYVYLNDWLPDTENDWGTLARLGPPPRWFTRGWTLQELIAPIEVEFYDMSWTFRGTKSDLFVAGELSRITGIDGSILQNGSEANLRRTCIGQRMSWAALRQTTRREDIAYCLLGIFQVNMPLLYGEGDRAFVRLQEEIIKTSTDFSLFAWKKEDHLRAQGVLSCHPREFGHLGKCEWTTNLFSEQEDEEAVMTNKGLRIETSSLFSFGADPSVADYQDLYLLLGCQVDGTPLGIRLNTRYGGVYARADQSTVFFPDPTISNMKRLSRRTIFICREADMYPKFPCIALFLQSRSPEYRLHVTEMWPPGLFYPSIASGPLYVRNSSMFVGYLKIAFGRYESGAQNHFMIVLRNVPSRANPEVGNMVGAHLVRQGREGPFLAFTDKIRTLEPFKAERSLVSDFDPSVLPDEPGICINGYGNHVCLGEFEGKHLSVGSKVTVVGLNSITPMFHFFLQAD
ncbi:heterokaryon incompatibility protein-domain-containing protein [Echria macrotheca]|uniref:Heterokaryon incompatibility protein-domain-containing protein n=1 Tax=Echria macrotheca TaxID=438768 RepID=A0AAJ0B1N2_9PEZI|nr:heterokaryon incompatibility protein-domain-containing protein [Echria macrotheca]